MSANDLIDIVINGRDYRVACAPDEREILLSAVNLVDERILRVASKSKSVNPERVAVMVALNIAHELLSSKPAYVESFDIDRTKRRIEGMEAQLENLLLKANESVLSAP